MASTSVIKPVPPRDLRSEINLFINMASKPHECNNIETTRKGISLLKALPSSRDAVFEFFSTIFDFSTFNHLLEIENRVKQASTAQPVVEDSVLDEVHNELSEFLTHDDPLPWAVVISNWTFDLLGHLSSLYSSRGRSPVNGSLNDSLHQWLTCRATRTLLDLSINCLEKLINSEECTMCIDVLLETCVKHSPHFDWAVAYVGTRFPRVIISGVLKCGLQDYVASKGNTNLPKFQSIIGILIYLCASHQIVIEEALLGLFKESLNEKSELLLSTERFSVVPYIFQLSSLSPVILSALVQVVIKALENPAYVKMEAFGTEWISLARTRQSFLDLVIHLSLSITENADQLFFLILRMTTHKNKIARVAEEILELLIKELEIAVKGNVAKVPFLESIQKNLADIFPLLLSECNSHTSAVTSILVLIGQQQPSILPQCVAYVLLRSKKDEHLASVVSLSLGYKSSMVLSPAITQALIYEKDVKDKSHVWDNISKLVKWQASGTLISLPILEAVYDNLFVISNFLCDEKEIKVAHTIAELIRKAIVEFRQLPQFVLSKAIIHAVIAYFYKCLVYAEGVEEMKGLRAVNSTLKKLCQESGSRRIYALRELLEGALFRTPSVLFGAIPKLKQSIIESSISLMDENIKQGHTALMGQRHSSVFHAGIIGSGKRKASPTCPTPYEDIIHNTNLLLSVIKACCTGENEVALESVISVALLLVELISPDVMYNGLPWPDEDFCKVTVERDLSIRRVFDNVPVVWSLLSFIAHHRPALCYCSVLLRAVVATLLGQWFAESQQGHGPNHNKQLVYTTVKTLQIMALGQLLPPPFTALGDVVPYVPPIHVVQILRDCVWNYMRDHVPSPALFTRDPSGNMWRDTSTSRPLKQYTETLRLIMLNNLSSLGSLFHTLFVEEND